MKGIIVALFAVVALTEKVTPSLRCPRDYEESGQACIRVEYTDFLYDCPKGTKKDRKGDGCIVTEVVAPEFGCPSGYVLNDRFCEKIYRAPVRYECEDSKFTVTTDNGDATCVRKVLHDPASLCPVNYKLTDNHTCLKIEKLQPRDAECPDGYTLNGAFDYVAGTMKDPHKHAFCETVLTEVPTMSCPKGYDLIDQSPFDALERGTSWSAMTEGRDYSSGVAIYRRRLAQKYATVPLEMVPKVPARCEKVETATQKLGCPRGFKLEEVQQNQLGGVSWFLDCVRQIEWGAPEYQCPDGTFMNKNRRCEGNERHPPNMSCKKDYELRNGKCIRILESPPDLSCDKGWRLVSDGVNSYCERKAESHTPPAPVCPGDSQLKMASGKSICINHETERPAAYCPVGFEPFMPNSMENFSLELRPLRELKASPAAFNTGLELDVAPLGFVSVSPNDNALSTVGISNGVTSRRQRVGKFREDSMCVKKSTAQPDLACGKKFTLNPNTLMCTSSVKIPPRFSCPAGSAPSGPRPDFCEVTSVLPPKVTCKSGESFAGTGCLEVIEKPAKRVCPRKYTFDSDQNDCVQTERVRPDKACPQGVPKGDHCEYTKYVEPHIGCPKGFVIGQSGACVKHHAMEMLPVCEPNYHFDGGFCVPQK